MSEYATLQNDRSVIKQVLRLVILQNRKTGDTYGFKMVVVPELDYMLRKDDAIGENKYLQRAADLSGTVLFYSLQDEFVNGWKYQNGKITGQLKKYKTDQKSNGFKSSNGLETYMVTTCNFYKTEIGNYVSYGSDCYNSYYLVTDFAFDTEVGLKNGDYNTKYGYGGEETIVYDCFGVPNGSAYHDKCDKCVGGTTGRLPCDKDCAELYSLKNDVALISKLQGYINDIESGSMLEDGFMKKSDGSYVSPAARTTDNVKFIYYSTDKFTERVHTHTIGTYIFSPKDISTVYSMLINGNMDDPLTFRYIVVSSLGIGYLQITDVNAFKTFGQNYKLSNVTQNDYKTKFESTMPNSGEMSDFLKHFVNLLSQLNSGLTFSLGVPNEFLNSIIDWNIVQSINSNDITLKNCNE